MSNKMRVAKPFQNLELTEKLVSAQVALQKLGGVAFNPRTYIQRSVCLSHFSLWPDFRSMVYRAEYIQRIKKLQAKQEEEAKAREAELPPVDPEESIRLAQLMADQFYDVEQPVSERKPLELVGGNDGV